MADKFEIQTVNRAFSGQIPEHLWKTVNRARTPLGALRHFQRWSRYYTPQQNAWSGHVRILRNGERVHIDPSYLEVYICE